MSINHRTFFTAILNVNHTLHIVQESSVLKDILYD